MEFFTFKAAVLIFVITFVSAQIVPAPFPFDCRRSNVNCATPNTCNPSNGQCVCDAATQLGYNCKLSTAAAVECDPAVGCQNNALCKNDDTCFCKSDTYGTKCQNPRVRVWCSQTGMFINIYPHGDASFTGTLFANTNPLNPGRDRPECKLTKITDQQPSALMTEYKVLDVQGKPTTLSGYYIALTHTQPEGATGPYCGAAAMTTDEPSGRVDYIQKVVVEYNSKIISSLDQVLAFNCSVSSTSSAHLFSSVNSMSVTIFDDDYQKVNATDTIEPITFEIRQPNGDVITNSINLGDPLDLVFTLTNPTASGVTANPTDIVDFSVISCTATNGQLAATEFYHSIDFLQTGCQAPASALLYRDKINETTIAGVGKKIIVPMNAFRFVGDFSQVAFTCQIKLCTQADVTATPALCAKPVCPEDSIGVQADSGTGTESGTGDTTTPPADSGTTAGGTRRKRAAADNSEQEVTKTIRVTSYLEGEQNTQGGTTTADCVVRTQVVDIIVIFSVILALMLIVIVVLVVRLLRSRSKVVDAPDLSDADTFSRYTLPRLSIGASYASATF